MLRLTNENLLVRVVDAVEETVERCEEIYNFPFSQLMLCVGGRGFVTAENMYERPFGKGAMFCADQGARCGIRTCGGPAIFRRIACDTDMAPNLMNYFEDGCLHLLEKCSDELLRQYGELYGLCAEDGAAENKNTSLKLYRVMIMLGQEIAGENDNEFGAFKAMVKEYEKYMFAKFAPGESVGAPPEVETLFLRVYGMGVDEYNVVMRYEKSKPFLCFKNDIGDIARYLRFASREEFEAGFASRYGLSPTEYIDLYH